MSEFEKVPVEIVSDNHGVFSRDKSGKLGLLPGRPTTREGINVVRQILKRGDLVHLLALTAPVVYTPVLRDLGLESNREFPDIQDWIDHQLTLHKRDHFDNYERDPIVRATYEYLKERHGIPTIIASGTPDCDRSYFREMIERENLWFLDPEFPIFTTPRLLPEDVYPLRKISSPLMKAVIVGFIQSYRGVGVRFVDDTIQAAETVVNLTGADAYVTLPKHVAGKREGYPDDYVVDRKIRFALPDYPIMDQLAEDIGIRLPRFIY